MGEVQTARWSLLKRCTFRFCFVYLGLFCLTGQILPSFLPFPHDEVPSLAEIPPIRPIVFWTGAHVFRSKEALFMQGGSGDKTFDWVLLFCLLLFSLFAAIVWSLLDRRRDHYATVHKWFRLFLRFALASQMILYGLIKVVPLQMRFPTLTKLIEPFGNFSPMGILWFSVGASPAYEAFAGGAELLAGILLTIPRTALLGALIGLIDMIQVFQLNMTYDVPVKIYSFHLLLLSLFLLAPELPRIGAVLLSYRPIEFSAPLTLFRGARPNRMAFVAQLLFGLSLVAYYSYYDYGAWFLYGPGRPKSPLYGIWNVDEMAIEGKLRMPLLTDYDRWRRVVFDFPNSMSFQRMDDSIGSFGAVLNTQ